MKMVVLFCSVLSSGSQFRASGQDAVQRFSGGMWHERLPTTTPLHASIHIETSPTLTTSNFTWVVRRT